MICDWILAALIRRGGRVPSWDFCLWGRCTCWWSLGEWVLSPWSRKRRCHWPACELYPEFPWNLQPTRQLSWNLGKEVSTGVVEHILVLLHQFVGPQIAVLVKEVNFEDLLAIWRVSIGEDVGDKEGEDVPKGSVADVGWKDVVVVGVEELSQQGSTSRAVKPPA